MWFHHKFLFNNKLDDFQHQLIPSNNKPDSWQCWWSANEQWLLKRMRITWNCVEVGQLNESGHVDDDIECLTTITTTSPCPHFPHHLWLCQYHKNHRRPSDGCDDNTVVGCPRSRSNVRIVLCGARVASRMERGCHSRYTCRNNK